MYKMNSKGNMERAYRYHRQRQKRRGASGGGGGECVNTRRFLAQYCAETGDLGEAEGYCMRLLDFGGNNREEAKIHHRQVSHPNESVPNRGEHGFASIHHVSDGDRASSH